MIEFLIFKLLLLCIALSFITVVIIMIIATSDCTAEKFDCNIKWASRILITTSSTIVILTLALLII